MGLTDGRVFVISIRYETGKKSRAYYRAYYQAVGLCSARADRPRSWAAAGLNDLYEPHDFCWGDSNSFDDFDRDDFDKAVKKWQRYERRNARSGGTYGQTYVVEMEIQNRYEIKVLGQQRRRGG